MSDMFVKLWQYGINTTSGRSYGSFNSSKFGWGNSWWPESIVNRENFLLYNCMSCSSKTLCMYKTQFSISQSQLGHSWVQHAGARFAIFRSIAHMFRNIFAMLVDSNMQFFLQFSQNFSWVWYNARSVKNDENAMSDIFVKFWQPGVNTTSGRSYGSCNSSKFSWGNSWWPDSIVIRENCFALQLYVVQQQNIV